ncbi:hlh transcription factor [Gigaspora margarita]|uniref:Hlh transcription factor n=1 Tax=Gigaspora margarita TaxID=4874 RepID=A0A8H4A7L1_GIGMA|nr:hlh transcription factor [Gigaspora margarita]
MESPMSESKYSFPNQTPPYDSKSMSFKSQTDQNMSISLTPSPPIPSPTSEPYPSRSLAPLEPSHSAIPSYLTAQRRGSITDPSLHMSVPNPELARQYSQPDVNFPSNSGSGSSERRSSFVSDQFPPSPFSSLSRSSSVKGEQSIQPFSPLETRKLRDALPSISASASPVRDGFPGPLMNPAFQAHLQPRRHSIAVGEVVAPLKRKNTINTIGTPAPTHPIMPEGYPVKRRESVSDPSIQRLSLYDRRNSYSAPSSPPAPPSSSLISSSNSLPKLNVQDVESSLQGHNESCSLPTSYNDNVPDHPGANNMSTSHISEQNDLSIAYPHFSNPRLSQIVQEEVSAPILARRASMPVMTFPSRFTESVQQDGVPMDVDRYRSQVYPTHHHSYHPYAYDYPGYIQQQPPVKDTPYSRSPELRISHKLAERKRRKEMKELFDELRDSLPVDKSLKTSKWEILSKAVDFINTLKHNQDEMAKEVESLRQQLAALKGCGSSETSTPASS